MNSLATRFVNCKFNSGLSNEGNWMMYISWYLMIFIWYKQYSFDKKKYLISSREASQVSLLRYLCFNQWYSAGKKLVTWLILPVVICLSQRLSHACLSISKSIQWNCEWLIKSVIVYLMIPYYLDNRGNSRANTCIKVPTSGRDVFIR